jgi:hypothetical protein
LQLRHGLLLVVPVAIAALFAVAQPAAVRGQPRAAIHDLRMRIASATGSNPWRGEVQSAWLAALAGVFKAHSGRTLGTPQLVAHLRANLAAQLQSAGLRLDPGGAEALVDGWAARWFVLAEWAPGVSVTR